jgi:hypothetical protein
MPLSLSTSSKAIWKKLPYKRVSTKFRAPGLRVDEVEAARGKRGQAVKREAIDLLPTLLTAAVEASIPG